MKFTVPGQPVGKQRPRVVRGHAFTPEKTRAYERHVLLCAKAAGIRTPIAGPVKLILRAFMGDARHRDLDNVCKSVTDALNGHAFNDDTQIVELHATKAIDRANPRAEIEIVALTDVTEAA